MSPGDLVTTKVGRTMLYYEPYWSDEEGRPSVDNTVSGFINSGAVALVLTTVRLPWPTIEDPEHTEEWCLLLNGTKMGWRESRFFVRAGEYETG